MKRFEEPIIQWHPFDLSNINTYPPRSGWYMVLCEGGEFDSLCVKVDMAYYEDGAVSYEPDPDVQPFETLDARKDEIFRNKILAWSLVPRECITGYSYGIYAGRIERDYLGSLEEPEEEPEE
jgi:hypothetical protein